VSEPGVDALFRPRKIYDLGHELSATMPVFADHVPYRLTLHRRHSDGHRRERPTGTSYATELIVTSAHVSTHIDALGHFSRGGCVQSGARAEEIESPEGLTDLHAGALEPIWRRGVLFDVAEHCGADALEPGMAIGSELLREVADARGVAPQRGDAILVRTGWSRHWGDAPRFAGRDGLPGLNADGAGWLVDLGAALIGSDTPVLEVIPFQDDSVHALLLVDRGVHIVENLVLDELAADVVTTFLFVGLPLRLVGATGSPFRPVAVV
jgi:kynurenine formamidase